MSSSIKEALYLFILDSVRHLLWSHEYCICIHTSISMAFGRLWIMNCSSTVRRRCILPIDAYVRHVQWLSGDKIVIVFTESCGVQHEHVCTRRLLSYHLNDLYSIHYRDFYLFCSFNVQNLIKSRMHIASEHYFKA